MNIENTRYLLVYPGLFPKILVHVKNGHKYEDKFSRKMIDCAKHGLWDRICGILDRIPTVVEAMRSSAGCSSHASGNMLLKTDKLLSKAERSLR